MDAMINDPLSSQRQEQTLEVQQQIRALARRDAEVRAHEQAHASVGGIYAGAPTYEYQRGPNGVSYAVGGHVDIDVGVIPGDPAATLAKMQVVQRAAVAVAEPSAADRAVAAKAAAQASQARAELAAQTQDDSEESEAASNVRNNPLSTLGASIDVAV